MLHTDPFRLNTKIHLTCVTCSLHLGLKEVQEYVKTFDPDELARCPITFDVSKLSVSVECCIENNSATPKWASQGSQYTLHDCSCAGLHLNLGGWKLSIHIQKISNILLPKTSCLEGLPVGSLRLPHICFTLIQTVSHWQPEGKMASLCVYWLCQW